MFTLPWETLRQSGRTCFNLDIHVAPLASVQGGTNSWENLVTCCSKCNSLKGSKTLQELKWKLKSKPRVRGRASPQANSWAGLA